MISSKMKPGMPTALCSHHLPHEKLNGYTQRRGIGEVIPGFMGVNVGSEYGKIKSYVLEIWLCIMQLENRLYCQYTAGQGEKYCVKYRCEKYVYFHSFPFYSPPLCELVRASFAYCVSPRLFWQAKNLWIAIITAAIHRFSGAWWKSKSFLTKSKRSQQVWPSVLRMCIWF